MFYYVNESTIERACQQQMFYEHLVCVIGQPRETSSQFIYIFNIAIFKMMMIMIYWGKLSSSLGKMMIYWSRKGNSFGLSFYVVVVKLL